MLKPQISWACSLPGNGSQTAADSHFLSMARKKLPAADIAASL
jgi:hypothetical protein